MAKAGRGARPRRATTTGYLNAFCVVALPAQASAQAIQQNAQRAIQQRRLQGGDAAEREIALIESAQELLRDPLERLRCGMHWLAYDERAAAGWISSAAKVLAFDETMLDCGTFAHQVVAPTAIARVHNDAVMASADAERLAVRGDLDEAVARWRDGWGRWKRTLSMPDFRDHVDALVMGIDDPQLTPDLVAGEIAAIDDRVLAPAAATAAECVLSRRTQDALNLVQQIKECGLSPSAIARSLSVIYGPTVERLIGETAVLRARVEALTKAHEAAPDTAIAAAAIRSVHASVLENLVPDLDQLLTIGDLPGQAEEHARDEVAEFLLLFSVASANCCADFDLAEQSLALAERYAHSKSLLSRIVSAKEAFFDTHGPLQVLPGYDEALGLSQQGRFVECAEALAQVRLTAVSRAISRPWIERLDLLIKRINEAACNELVVEAAALRDQRRPRALVRAKLEAALRHASDAQRADLEALLQTIGPSSSDRNVEDGVFAHVPLLAFWWAVLVVVTGIVARNWFGIGSKSDLGTIWYVQGLLIFPFAAWLGSVSASRLVAAYERKSRAGVWWPAWATLAYLAIAAIASLGYDVYLTAGKQVYQWGWSALLVVPGLLVELPQTYLALAKKAQGEFLLFAIGFVALVVAARRWPGRLAWPSMWPAHARSVPIVAAAIGASWFIASNGLDSYQDALARDVREERVRVGQFAKVGDDDRLSRSDLAALRRLPTKTRYTLGPAGADIANFTELGKLLSNSTLAEILKTEALASRPSTLEVIVAPGRYDLKEPIVVGVNARLLGGEAMGVRAILVVNGGGFSARKDSTLYINGLDFEGGGQLPQVLDITAGMKVENTRVTRKVLWKEGPAIRMSAYGSAEEDAPAVLEKAVITGGSVAIEGTGKIVLREVSVDPGVFGTVAVRAQGQTQVLVEGLRHNTRNGLALWVRESSRAVVSGSIGQRGIKPALESSFLTFTKAARYPTLSVTDQARLRVDAASLTGNWGCVSARDQASVVIMRSEIGSCGAESYPVYLAEGTPVLKVQGAVYVRGLVGTPIENFTNKPADGVSVVLEGITEKSPD